MFWSQKWIVITIDKFLIYPKKSELVEIGIQGIQDEPRTKSREHFEVFLADGA